MATKITTDDIKQINELYYIYHTYAEVARQTGFSAGTVKKYVDKNFVPINDNDVKYFDLKTDFPPFNPIQFRGLENFGELCVLSPEEIIELEEFKRKEVSV